MGWNYTSLHVQINFAIMQQVFSKHYNLIHHYRQMQKKAQTQLVVILNHIIT